ncbi:hypothetical protein WL76_25970 [Burkholderia ubonensis]|uniref:Formaldehyde-activating enzyme domain-containing protein n=1 Tax=Burkholderia ubonensis TaxID=101571 RepID=A0A119V0Y4_9BURK|nr:formaldehyde-activating enzyme [Burkholderia ubonensis]KWE47691.1 hypothetical protein WL76_25970 [Burkholderia ubonensis]KWK85677.1 hypothetical protein WM16_30295 [Burkholderia ubonensis]
MYVLIGPRDGPAGQAFATALATPSTGHAPFVVIAQPGVPTKPLTLYVNKAQIAGDFHGNADVAAMEGLPHRDAVFAAAHDVSNPFYTPKQR